MALTIRQQIIEVVKTRLAKITKVNGYQTDLGKVVYYGRLQSPHPSEMPALNIWDEDELLAKEFGIRSRSFNLMIEAYHQVKELAMPEIGNILKADIDYAILRKADNQNKIDDTFNYLVQDFEFVRFAMFQLTTNDKIGGIVYEYKIVYQQALADPYKVEGR